MEEKYKFNYKKVFIPFFCLLLSFTIIGFNFNKVNASSTDFIQSSPYHISMGALNSYEFTYAEIPVIQYSSVDSSFLTFNKYPSVTTNRVMDYNIDVNACMPNGTFSEVRLAKGFASDTDEYKYFSNTNINLKANYFVFEPSSMGFDEGYISSSSFTINQIGVTIPYNVAVSNIDNFFSTVNYIQTTYNIDDTSVTGYGGDVVINIAYSSTSDFTTTLFTISIYISASDFPYEYDGVSQIHEVLKIDRSQYVSYEQIEVPTGELLIFDSIVNGVNTFLEIQLFPNFTISHILLLAVGISILMFMLHLIIK